MYNGTEDFSSGGSEEMDEETPVDVGEISAALEEALPRPSPEQEKFTRLLTDILALTQELALEIVTLNCRIQSTCPLARKSKELVGKLKEMVELGKSMSRTPPPSPATVRPKK